MGIPDNIRRKLEHNFPYVWKDSGISYLGITLTSKVEDLFKANYTSFLYSLHSKLDKVARVKLLWMGCLAAFKIQILPQLVYLFRTLPIPVPSSYLSTLQSILDKYLWHGKKACLVFGKLIKHRNAGGVGHTQICDYYFASLLAQLRRWMDPESDSMWAELERSQIEGGICILA